MCKDLDSLYLYHGKVFYFKLPFGVVVFMDYGGSISLQVAPVPLIQMWNYFLRRTDFL